MAISGDDSSGSMPQTKCTDSSHIEKPIDDATLDEFAQLDEVSPEQHRKTFWKVDWHLMPMLMALYLIANLDRYGDPAPFNPQAKLLTLVFFLFRANLGNAKIENLEADLGMSGRDYNICNMMFFIPYILCEVPANWILVKFKRPSVWIGIIVTAWGIVMTCSGFSQSFAGLIVCRLLLGVFE